VIPVPLKLTEVRTVPFFLFRFMLPATLPALEGEKVTWKDALCPGLNVVGKLSPVTLNPAPLIVALAIVRLKLPLFSMTTFCVCEDPRIKLPNATFVGLIANMDLGPAKPVVELRIRISAAAHVGGVRLTLYESIRSSLS